MRTLEVESYVEQVKRWPQRGQHVLAQFDAESVVVYQAYRPSIGAAAVADQAFGGGGWSLDRMSWVKPNFLWMMYRCGWASKDGQESVLAIWLARAAFDEILGAAVPSSFDAERYADQGAWQDAVKRSDVRLQWDPDHAPNGAAETRRAVQLGMRRAVLAKFAKEWILEIQDITERVTQMRTALDRGGTEALVCPREHVYPATVGA